MACALGFQELANRNPYVRDLVDQGYAADLVAGYFVIYGIPYLNSAGELKYGDLISNVDLSEDGVINAPQSHQVWFNGEKPHALGGAELKVSCRDNRIQITDSLSAPYSFSLKILDENGEKRSYNSFEEKIQTYLDVVMSPAMTKFDEANPFRGIQIRAEEQQSPLRFPDTLSANYGMNDISSLLRGKKVAIVGLGGTGAYILDFVARTHLGRIALFDDDKIHIHTLFRMPGHIPGAIGKAKVDALAEHYRNWHAEIHPHKERVTAENVETLREFDFVFVSVDDGPSRRFIVEKLCSMSIPFVDCGMGLNRSVVGLNGMVRITGVDGNAFARTVGTPYLPTIATKEDEYRKQAQIVELNALNASLAVIRFKQHFLLLDRVDAAAWYTFETASFALDKEQLLE